MNLHCWLHDSNRIEMTKQDIAVNNIMKWGKRKIGMPVAVVETTDEQIAMIPARLSTLDRSLIIFTSPIKCVMRGVRHPDRDDLVMWMEKQFIMNPGDTSKVHCGARLNVPMSVVMQHPDIVEGCDQ